MILGFGSWIKTNFDDLVLDMEGISISHDLLLKIYIINFLNLCTKTHIVIVFIHVRIDVYYLWYRDLLLKLKS